MSDWSVWPIFTVEIIAIILLFVKKDKTIFSLSIRRIILGMLLVCCVAIGVSLYHDSSTLLHLYF